MAKEEKIPVFGRGMRNTGGFGVGGSLKSKHSKHGKFGDSKMPSKGPQPIDVAPVNPGVPVIPVNPGKPVPGKPVVVDPIKNPVAIDPGKKPGGGLIADPPKKKP